MKTHQQLAAEAIGFVSRPVTLEEMERIKRREMDRKARRKADKNQVRIPSKLMQFNEQLKQWRGALAGGRGDFSQAAAAEFLGVPLKTYIDWEQGRRTPAEFVQKTVKEKMRNRPVAG